jgi:hypothetical protein
MSNTHSGEDVVPPGPLSQQLLGELARFSSRLPPFAEHGTLHLPADVRERLQSLGSSLSVRPTEGTGPAALQVTGPAPASEVDRTEKVTITSAGEGSVAFEVRIRAVAGPDTPPFGVVDAPADPVTPGRDPILFQGWALDDTAMKRVWVAYVDASGRVVAFGDARRKGRRPDVAAVFPTAHDLFKAAWAFTLEPAAGAFNSGLSSNRYAR